MPADFGPRSFPRARAPRRPPRAPQSAWPLQPLMYVLSCHGLHEPADLDGDTNLHGSATLRTRFGRRVSSKSNPPSSRATSSTSPKRFRRSSPSSTIARTPMDTPGSPASRRRRVPTLHEAAAARSVTRSRRFNTKTLAAESRYPAFIPALRGEFPITHPPGN